MRDRKVSGNPGNRFRFDRPVHFQIPVLLTPGEILHANSIGVLPIEEVNSGTVNLHLNAVVRNPKQASVAPNQETAKSPNSIQDKAAETKEKVKNRKSDNLRKKKRDEKSKPGAGKIPSKKRPQRSNLKTAKGPIGRKSKWARSKKKGRRQNKQSWADQKSIEERLEEHCWETSGSSDEKKAGPRENAYTASLRGELSKQVRARQNSDSMANRLSFNRKNFTENVLGKQPFDLVNLQNTLNFSYYPGEGAQQRQFRTTKSLKTEWMQMHRRQRQGTEKPSATEQPVDELHQSPIAGKLETSSQSASDEEEGDTYSIEPQESLSKMTRERGHLPKQFYRQILSTMSIKSSNPIRTHLNKKFKSKKLKPNVSFREPFGEEETPDLGSNKSFKFLDKNSNRSKQELFNISDNKSRLSNFSADLFPSNSNFTYDVNKIKQIRKNEIYKEATKGTENSQHGTRSQTKLIPPQKSMSRAPKRLQKSQRVGPSEDELPAQNAPIVLNDNRHYHRVVYNTNQVSHQQLNIINMTLSVQAGRADKLMISRDHHDSYTYSKNSTERWVSTMR